MNLPRHEAARPPRPQGDGSLREPMFTELSPTMTCPSTFRSAWRACDAGAFLTQNASVRPKGGGAIRGTSVRHQYGRRHGIDVGAHCYKPRPRASFGPELTLSFDSDNGNGLFGFGWYPVLPHINRITDKVPRRFADSEESHVCLLSGYTIYATCRIVKFANIPLPASPVRELMLFIDSKTVYDIWVIVT